MIRALSLRAIAKQARASIWIAASAFCFLAMMATFALAQEETATPDEQAPQEEPADPSVDYSPDFCEFAITFPDEPYKSKRCEDSERTQCFDVISYTQVYELSATVNFRVICNPVDETLYNDYSAEVMETTLRAMTKQSVVDEFSSAFREEEGYKQAGLVGEGKVGKTSSIYIAQLWIGKHSALSVEAELIGDAHDTADKLFSDILKSVRYASKAASSDKTSPGPKTNN